MVVGMMKWRPWPPLYSKKFEVKIIIRHLRDLPENTPTADDTSQDLSRLAVEVKWKGSNKPNNPLSFKRRSVRRNVTKKGSLKDDRVIEWNEEFVTVCNFLGLKDGGFHQWEVAFTVFDDQNQEPKKRYSTIATGLLDLVEYSSSTEQNETEISIPLSMASGLTESGPILCVSLSLQELRISQDSTEQAQRSIIPLPLSLNNEVSTTEKDEPTGLKAGLKKVRIFRAISTNRPKKQCQEDEGSDGKSSVRTSDADYPFDSDSLEADEVDSEEVKDSDSTVRKSFSYGTLAYANHAGGLSYFNSSSSEDEDWIYYRNYKEKSEYLNESIIDQPLEKEPTKRSIFPWRKRKLSFRSPKTKGEPLLKKDSGEEGGDDIDFDRRMLSSSDESSYAVKVSNANSISEFGDEFGDDNFAVGKWENKEVVSRDGHMKLETQVFFASIDQRSERAAGESACTALVAVVADWLQNNANEMPIKSQLDSLIRDGSLEWRNLCGNEVFKDRFPDKHFDLETVLEAKIRNLSVNPEKSFIGFFQPEGLEEGDLHFLDGAMSFDGIWDEIEKIGETYTDGMNPLVYIVSWNDHFFVLKVEHDAYYIIDTLGERLYEGCDQAYVLKFDKDTVIERVAVDGQKSEKTTEGERVEERECSDGAVTVVGNGERDFVCKGKESCKEYIKSFLAAIPIRELKADLKKGLTGASVPVVHHRLQIEFHHTECLRDPRGQGGEVSLVEAITESMAITV